MSAEAKPEGKPSHENQNAAAAAASSSSSSPTSSSPQESAPSLGIDPADALRNAPTFVEEEKSGTGVPITEGEDGSDHEAASPQPGLVDKIMTKLGLNPIILMSMFKASLAPVIAISMFQAPAIQTLLSTLGYLTGIISVLSLALLPRGKFIQNMTLNLLTSSIGSAMAMLITWSSVQARLHTSDLPDMYAYIAANGRAPYNSSQSAVCALWLIFNIWLGNTIRAKYPAFNLPIILYSIMVNIASTFGPEFPTVASAEAFIRELIIAIFLGLAIGSACSLFIFPISTRQIVVKQMAGVLGLFKKTIALEKKYLQGLESDDMFTLEIIETSAGPSGTEAKDKTSKGKGKGKKGDKGPKLTKEQKTAVALRGVISASKDLMGKIYGDIKFAKRDVAFGHLTAKDFGELSNLIRNILIPITGIGVIMDIFQKVGRDAGWDGSGSGPQGDCLGLDTNGLDRDASVKVWQEMMKQLHEPFEILSEALIQGIDHAGILLNFFPLPKELKRAAKEAAAAAAAANANANANAKTNSTSPGQQTTVPDVEASAGGGLRPGQLGFSEVVNARLATFNARKGEILRVWAKEKGLSADGEHWDTNNTRLFEKRRNDQAQLYVILYLEKLMQATGEAVQDFVAFAEEKTRDGSIAKTHLVLPSWRRLRKWFTTGILGGSDDVVEEASSSVLAGGARANVVFVGPGWTSSSQRDPEHRRPRTTWQRVGHALRLFSNFFGSPESLFGFRVVCATMTVGILAFLEETQRFFIEQRLVWAMIIIAIGMTQTSGQSIFGFFCRVIGTFFAMVNSFIIWYIVDSRTGGVLVFLWLFSFVEFAFFFKYPQVIPGVMICIVTQVLIIGYELQVRSLGVAKAEASGQPVYPLYLLAPYRLATVAAGCFIAFFWTVFPSPYTDSTWLRKDLSATLYMLANYSSVIYTTMRATMKGDLGDMETPGSPAHKLFKVRRKLFGKLTLLLPSLQAHANFQRFEPTLGGEFPSDLYQDIIQRSQRMMNYFTLMSYILTWAPKGPAEDSDKAWMRVLGEVMEDVSPIHTQILSTLTLLSNCLLSGQSLPPYLPLPDPHEMTRHLLRLPHEHAKKAAAAAAVASGAARAHHSSSPSRSSSSASSSSSSSAAGEEQEQGQQQQQEERPQDEDSPPVQKADTDNTATGTSNAEPDAWNLLDARNMEQKGYTEFAVIQVCSMLIVGELAGLIKTMGQLVGTVDFSFRVEKKNNSRRRRRSRSRGRRNSNSSGVDVDDDDDDDNVSTSSSAESYHIQRMGTYASRATGSGPGGDGDEEGVGARRRV